MNKRITGRNIVEFDYFTKGIDKSYWEYYNESIRCNVSPHFREQGRLNLFFITRSVKRYTRFP